MNAKPSLPPKLKNQRTRKETHVHLLQIVKSHSDVPVNEVKQLPLDPVDLLKIQPLDTPPDAQPSLVREVAVAEEFRGDHVGCEEETMSRRSLVVRVEGVKSVEDDESSSEDFDGKLSLVDAASDEGRQGHRTGSSGRAEEHCHDLRKREDGRESVRKR